MITRPERRALLRRLYGFDFPADFYAFWEFANRLRPLEPLRSLDELGLTLVGPYDVLAGRFDGISTRLSQYLHWRYHQDPPEFFTVLYGGEGLHWGYYLDDPAGCESCVASYYAGGEFEIEADGDTLFEAVRLHLEMSYRDRLEDQDIGLGDETAIRALDRVRERLLKNATSQRPETGQYYEELYPATSRRTSRIVARTLDGMGVVVPANVYRPLSVTDKELRKLLRRKAEPFELLQEARQALHDGFSGTALKLGKDLWAVGGERRSGIAFELLEAAYDALGRGVLRNVLAEHHAHRELPSVDILENDQSPEA